MSCCQENLSSSTFIDSKKKSCCDACHTSNLNINYGAIADLLTVEFIITPDSILPCNSDTFIYPMTVSTRERVIKKSEVYKSSGKIHKDRLDCCRIRTQAVLDTPMIMRYRDIYTSPDAEIARTRNKNEKIVSDMDLALKTRSNMQTPNIPYTNGQVPYNNNNGQVPYNNNNGQYNNVQVQPTNIQMMNNLPNNVQMMNNLPNNIQMMNNIQMPQMPQMPQMQANTVQANNGQPNKCMFESPNIYENDGVTKRALDIKANAYLENPGNSCNSQVNRNAELSYASVLNNNVDNTKPIFNYPNLITPLNIDPLIYNSPDIYRNPNLYEYNKPIIGTLSSKNTIFVDPVNANLSTSPDKWVGTSITASPHRWVDPLSQNIDIPYSGLTLPGYPGIPPQRPNFCNNTPLISDPPNNPSTYTFPSNQIIGATNLTTDDNTLYPALSIKSVYDLESNNMIITYLLYKSDTVTYEQCVTLSLHKVGPILNNVRKNSICLSNAQRINLLLGVGLVSEFQSPTPQEIDNAFVIWLYTYIGYVGGTYWKCCGERWINVGFSNFEFAPYDENLVYGINSFNVDYMLERLFQQYSKQILDLQYPLILPKWRRFCSMARSNWDILMFNGCHYGEDIAYRKQIKLTQLITDNLWQIKQTLQILLDGQKALDDRISSVEVILSKLTC